MLNIGGWFYDNNKWRIKYIINSDMQINFPYFSRYIPYLKTEYIYRNVEQISQTSSANSILEIHLNNMNKIAHRLNFEFGFDLESFKVSYHYENILGEDGRFVNNYEEVPIHKYLKVEWKFRN